MLNFRLVDPTAAVQRIQSLQASAPVSGPTQLSRDLEEFRKAALEQHRQKFQDAFNQQMINAQINLVGQASKIRDKLQS